MSAMQPPPHERRDRSGFSLIEVLITVSLVGTFLGSLLLVINAGSKAARTGMARQSTEGLARRCVDRMASELVSSASGTLSPDPVAPWGTSALTFQRIEGYTAGAIDWGTPVRLSLELDVGELDDGVDNNGNGLVDERRLVYTIDPGGAEESTTWAHGVRELLEGESPNALDDNGNGLKDEAGLSFQRVGGRLLIRLSLQENDGQGNVLVHTVTTTVRLRNTE
jgi:prepilin-type N-terminal cleavage/methylation domain-containing protein